MEFFTPVRIFHHLNFVGRKIDKNVESETSVTYLQSSCLYYLINFPIISLWGISYFHRSPLDTSLNGYLAASFISSMKNLYPLLADENEGLHNLVM